MNNIAVCYCCDNNYIQHLGASISSILKSKKEDEFIRIYIADGGISNGNKLKLSTFEAKYACKIEYILPDLDKLQNLPVFKGDYISLPAYYRLLIPEMVIDEARVIYLDCDTIVRKSLSEFYNKNFNNNLLLGVIDVAAEDHSKRLSLNKYINSGVLLLNLEQMRRENSVDKIVNWISNNKEKIECHDQDIINAALSGALDYVDPVYNAQVRQNNFNYFDKIEDPIILHFISSKKPWVLWKSIRYTHWEKEYFEALINTPWQKFIKSYKIKSFFLFPLKVFYPTDNYKKFLEWIFSIKNSDDRKFKIITFTGIKILKNKKNIVKRGIYESD